ncbi:DJ-1/PfpI family protein [Bacillus sp. 31A1R]|uniref:DJ-1/PfpI family protein n=1 Tax=Robertmurraya mangrovi TaxID=3098077 RepID=A0ABU5J2W4_9BACI|nr:DJ-1/PfpI family protein [Bacillus sp. 31A1R]MDZ5473759.1 DJ-1/PfpI family protein [Bacillus sp. 31A1R]
MTTGILLYPRFSEYELSVILSVLTQANHPKIFIGLNDEPIKGEAGLVCIPETTIDKVNIDQIQSLVLPGVDDFQHLIDEEPLFEFIREVYKRDAVIGAISSAPFMLAKAGVLSNRFYTCGITKQARDFLSFFPEDGFVDAPYVFDKGVLTAKGSYFIDFANKFGQVLELDFNRNWYR